MNFLRLCLAVLTWTGSLLIEDAAAAVVINEIHHSPDVKQEAVEFIELVNAGQEEVDLGGWRFTSGVEFGVPAGTRIRPGGFAVVAAKPAAVERKFGIGGVLGPWIGSLSGQTEVIRLVDASGGLVDEVDYQLGFPWPTVGDAPGYSIELVHPSLDNGLGGNWRASVVGNPALQNRLVLPANAAWRYQKGRAEASSPATAWREPGFGDTGWPQGTLPIGYDPDIRFGTPLGDMRVDGVAQYITIFLRNRFMVEEAAAVRKLVLEALYDDGFKLWVNGRLLLSQNIAAGEVPFDQDAQSTRESNNYEKFDIDVPPDVLRDGENVVCVQVANGNQGNSSDCFFDCRLSTVSGPTYRGPTPGATNSVFAVTAPPAVRQVRHEPAQPHAGQPVVVTARVTDPEGVRSVRLLTQLVEPGAYLPIDQAGFESNWTATPMTAVGTNGLYSVTIPPAVQEHRRLVRYRIVAEDGGGAGVTVPYPDDPQPNFAYFVYDGVPAWSGAVQPGAAGELGERFTVGVDEMNRLPVIHLLARRQDVENCTWRDRSHGDEYFWRGTIVFDGEVYDHVRMRPRGGVWRYAMGKNMWKFDFNRGHDLRMRDNRGGRMRAAWTKLNLGACIQQGDFRHRGEQGMFESTGFRFFQLAGVPAMDTTFVQFRVIDDAAEAPSDNQYAGDFWGLYLAVEQPDGRFLDAHGLPDGNFYKMEGGFGDPNNLGPDGPVDASDLRAFLASYGSTNYLTLNADWWRTNMNLPAYYSYQTIVQAIHHYDIGDGKNYYFYRQPVDGRWMSIPWDLDLTWADNMYRAGQSGDTPNGGGEPFKLRLLSDFKSTALHPALQREFRNRVREIRDLLWNEEQAWALIDEMASLVRGTNATSLLDADRAQWDYNPLMMDSTLVNTNKAGWGRFYRVGVGTRDFAGMVRKMKDYVTYRASDKVFSLDTLSTESGLPSRPSVTDRSPATHPSNQLRFDASPYSGGSSAASVFWRLAEVSKPGLAGFDPSRAWRYEIEPTWESGAVAPSATSVEIPAGLVRPGRTYRVRARYMDVEGRASRWSDPVEFVAGESDAAAGLVRYLKLTELMYNPPAEGFEFIELHNTSQTDTLKLEGASFTDGIDYTFPPGSSIGPGGYRVIVRTDSAQFAAFREYHRLPKDFPLDGPYSGSLDNGGETLTLRTGPGGSVVFSLAWSDSSPWPEAADGKGRSLVPAPGSLDWQGGPDTSLASNWRASAEPGGSPGRTDDLRAALRIAEFVVLPGGARITVEASPNASFQVQHSRDLVHWAPVEEWLGGGTRMLVLPDGGVMAFIRLSMNTP